MSKKEQLHQEDSFETVQSALSKSERFIENNQKILSSIILGVLLVVAGYMAFNRFIIEPKEELAKADMYVAEQYFQRDSFNLALNGDGNYYGFLEVIDSYGMTKTSNLAKYYAGICYLHLGDFEQAVKYLGKFDSDDKIVSSVAYGAMGDAYSEMNEYSKAASYYEKAAKNHPNEFTTPMYLNKAALVYEQEGSYKKALATYEKIKKEYPKSNEGRSVEKYIERVKNQL